MSFMVQQIYSRAYTIINDLGFSPLDIHGGIYEGFFFAG
jgi:hypothetical protein